MKNFHYFYVAAILGLVLFLANCGQVNSGTSSITTTFYTNSASTTPVFTPVSASSSSIKSLATTTWGSGNPLYRVYFSLREFLHSRDEGIVDRTNLYKLLYDVDTVFSGLTAEAQALTAETSITPPFSKLTSIVCDKAINDTANKRAIAMKETAAEVNGIISWIWTDSSTKEEYGVASVQFNKSTKDLTIDMTYSVDYDLSNTATDYNLRCYVTGNADTSTFQFKYIIGDTKIVAKGVSKGAGNYMLFKYTDAGEPTKYIVASAEAEEAYFVAENTTPANITTEASSLPSTVSSYKDWVTAEAFFTASDLVSDKSQLNSGNSRSGTIYINY